MFICAHSHVSAGMRKYVYRTLSSFLSLCRGGRLLLLDTPWWFYWLMNTAACLLATDVSLSGTLSARCASTPGVLDTSDMTKMYKFHLWCSTRPTIRVQPQTLTFLHTDRQWPTIVIFHSREFSVTFSWITFLQFLFVKDPGKMLLDIVEASHTHTNLTHMLYPQPCTYS